MFLIPTIIGMLYEFVLAIPIIGGLIVVGSSYGTIGVALVIHGIILACRIATKDAKIVPILALIGTCLTWIPFVGWFIHAAIGIGYFIDLFFGRKNR